MKLFDFLAVPVVKQRFLVMINLSSLVAALEMAKIFASSFLHKVKSLEHLLPYLLKINVLVRFVFSVQLISLGQPISSSSITIRKKKRLVTANCQVVFLKGRFSSPAIRDGFMPPRKGRISSPDLWFCALD